MKRTGALASVALVLAGCGSSRALGNVVRDHTYGPTTVHHHAHRPDNRMKSVPLVLLDSLVALAAGVGACVVVILLAVDTLG